MLFSGGVLHDPGAKIIVHICLLLERLTFIEKGSDFKPGGGGGSGAPQGKIEFLFMSSFFVGFSMICGLTLGGEGGPSPRVRDLTFLDKIQPLTRPTKGGMYCFFVGGASLGIAAIPVRTCLLYASLSLLKKGAAHPQP